MISLKTSLGNVYFYIKGTVIYKISSKDDGTSCAYKGVSGNPSSDNEVVVPQIIVTNNETSAETTYYLTNLISVGDEYSANTFIKQSCESSVAPIAVKEYYEQLCEEQIKKSIINNSTKEFDYWNEHKNLLGIPMWMIKGEGYSISGANQIDFKDTYFNDLKKEVARDQAYNAAENIAKIFGYKVKTLTVQKNS